jgi:hypothetical protein
MGNKDKGKKETKKVAKKQPKPPPGRARGDINQATTRTISGQTDKP